MSGRPQFAIVREDAQVERTLIERFGAKNLLVVASGGCTALTLSRTLPVSVTAFDLNPVQIAHCQARATAGPEHLAALEQCGAFEGLFRVLRTVIDEFVAGPGELSHYFLHPGGRSLVPKWMAHRYWPVAFQLAFADPLLETMFGPAATQHAEPGSYPSYFRRAFERGLEREDGPHNRFLQHALLGAWLERDAPAFVGHDDVPVDWVLGDLLSIEDLDRFDLVSLSNIFDWSDDTLVEAWSDRLRLRLKPGAAVVMRQLNNRRDLRRLFRGFEFDDALGKRLLAHDRSLFYERIEVARRA